MPTTKKTTKKVAAKKTANKQAKPEPTPVEPFEPILHLKMQQRSYEWFDMRAGKLSASEAAAWLLKDDKRSTTAREKMLCKKLAEECGYESPPIFENWFMERGTKLEPEAVKCFEQDTGLIVTECGFIEHPECSAGCSPDGLVMSAEEAGDWKTGFEGKVPAPETHVFYMLHPEALPDTYHWQVQFSMAVSGFESWWLQSYCPNLPAVRLLMKRDEETDAIASALKDWTAQLNAARNSILGKIF